MTQRSSADRLVSMQRLNAQVLDLLAGLPTLVALGRERGPAARVRTLGEAHRRATNETLRTAFLSSMVLELVTTLSVALVAVGVGLRLLSASLDLRTALVVLVLAPEVYLPLRQVGTQFHASTNGLAAVDQAFAVLHLPLPPSGTVTAPDLRTTTIVLRDVVVQHEGRRLPAPDGASLTLRPGTVTVLSGPSGSGKSTLAEVVLRLRTVQVGRAEVVDASGRRTPLAAIEQRSWLDQAAWLGQQAVVVPGTLRANALLLGDGDGTEAALTRAAAAAGLTDVVAGLPRGWDTPVGDGGYGLSAGQRQRLALTRVLLADAQLVVLDEPTAHLDRAAEDAVRTAVAALSADGRTVLVIAHRAALATGADQVVTLAPPTRAPHRTGEPAAAASAGETTRLVGAP
jgi:ATP-binding cassette subfamily C protein CydD